MVRIGVWTKPRWARPSGTELDVAYDDPQGLEARRRPEQQRQHTIDRGWWWLLFRMGLSELHLMWLNHNGTYVGFL